MNILQGFRGDANWSREFVDVSSYHFSNNTKTDFNG